MLGLSKHEINGNQTRQETPKYWKSFLKYTTLGRSINNSQLQREKPHLQNTIMNIVTSMPYINDMLCAIPS